MLKTGTFRYYPFNEKVLNLFDTTKAEEIHDKIIIISQQLKSLKQMHL